MRVAKISKPYSNTHNIIAIDAISNSHCARNAKLPLCAITAEARNSEIFMSIIARYMEQISYFKL